MQIRGTGSSWCSILGDEPIASDGEILLTFQVTELVETVEFGFAPADVWLTTYFGENPLGFCYQFSASRSSNDGLWNSANHTSNYGERGYAGDIVDCILNWETGKISFKTIRGEQVIDHGVAYTNESIKTAVLFPAISVYGHDKVWIIN